MPNRLIKESICTSESVDKLTAFQETVFYRLIVNCDDYGRMDARPDILASKLFPLRRAMPTKKMKDSLEALANAELVTIYEVDGKPFLQMKTWNKHQQVRAKKSKYPAPETATQATDNTCNQMISDSSKCPRNPIQSESNTESESNTNTNPTRMRAREEETDDGFEAFWNAYPRKVGGSIQQAYLEYLHVTQDLGIAPSILIEAATEQGKDLTYETVRYFPGAEKWLRNRGWEQKKPKGGGKETNNIFLEIYNEEHSE